MMMIIQKIIIMIIAMIMTVLYIKVSIDIDDIDIDDSTTVSQLIQERVQKNPDFMVLLLINC